MIKKTNKDIIRLAKLFEQRGTKKEPERGGVFGINQTENPPRRDEIEIWQSDRQRLDWIQENFKGYGIIYKVDSPMHPRRKPKYMWRCQGTPALKFLKLIYPYLQKEEIKQDIRYVLEYEEKRRKEINENLETARN